MMTVVFVALWITTLVLVLYFQLERLAYRQEQRWSLMKMLGSKPLRVMAPLFGGQILRISIGALVASLVATFLTEQFSNLFSWNWAPLGVWSWAASVVLSCAIGGGVFFTLFSIRYRKVALG